MTRAFRSQTMWIALAASLTLVLSDSRISAGQPSGTTLSTLPLSWNSATGSTAIRGPTSVQWQGRQYNVDQGVEILMNVIRDTKTNAKNRGLALLDLSRVRTQLDGRPCLDELAALYNAPGKLDKAGILLCFIGSSDPRGIPVFIRALDEEQSTKLRLAAAGGLAQWNVRRGVGELVSLLDSNEVLPRPARLLNVRDNARELFETKNRLKGWGFPEERIKQPIVVRADLDRDQMRALYIAEIKKWFEANKERFPDWKRGDPLPEVSKVKGKPDADK